MTTRTYHAKPTAGYSLASLKMDLAQYCGVPNAEISATLGVVVFEGDEDTAKRVGRKHNVASVTEQVRPEVPQPNIPPIFDPLFEAD